MKKVDITRRRILMGAAAGSAATMGMTAPAAKTGEASSPTICLFSKHLPHLNYPELAKSLRDFGSPGVDLTVRPKGHVLPENVERDLPKAVDALRAEGITIPMVTTGLTSASDPAARPTLYTAAKLGVPLYKLGYYRYGDLTKLDETLERVKREVEGLAALGRHAGIQGGFHTHSGRSVGAVMWDNWWIQRDADPQWMSYYYDPCHATIEGGAWGWKVGYHRLADRSRWCPSRISSGKNRTGSGIFACARWEKAWCGSLSFSRCWLRADSGGRSRCTSSTRSRVRRSPCAARKPWRPSRRISPSSRSTSEQHLGSSAGRGPALNPRDPARRIGIVWARNGERCPQESACHAGLARFSHHVARRSA